MMTREESNKYGDTGHTQTHSRLYIQALGPKRTLGVHKKCISRYKVPRTEPRFLIVQMLSPFMAFFVVLG